MRRRRFSVGHVVHDMHGFYTFAQSHIGMCCKLAITNEKRGECYSRNELFGAEEIASMPEERNYLNELHTHTHTNINTGAKCKRKSANALVSIYRGEDV